MQPKETWLELKMPATSLGHRLESQWVKPTESRLGPRRLAWWWGQSSALMWERRLGKRLDSNLLELKMPEMSLRHRLESQWVKPTESRLGRRRLAWWWGQSSVLMLGRWLGKLSEWN